MDALEIEDLDEDRRLELQSEAQGLEVRLKEYQKCFSVLPHHSAKLPSFSDADRGSQAPK